MSLIQLISDFFNKDKATFEIAGFKFDCEIEEAHESKLITTDSPLESGALATDHSYFEPQRYSVNGFMTGYDPNSFGGSETRIEDAYKQLRIIQMLREPLSIKTAIGEYQDMLLDSVIMLKGVDDKADFSLTLKEVTFKETQTVSGLVVDAPQPTKKSDPESSTKPDGAKKESKSEKQSSKVESKGKTQPKKEDPPPKKKSAAKTIGDIIRGA